MRRTVTTTAGDRSRQDELCGRIDEGYRELVESAPVHARWWAALVGSADHGTTKGLYAKDPDGLEFEVCWLVPAELIDDQARGHRSELDIDANIARYGADTPGACARIGVAQ